VKPALGKTIRERTIACGKTILKGLGFLDSPGGEGG